MDQGDLSRSILHHGNSYIIVLCFLSVGKEEVINILIHENQKKEKWIYVLQTKMHQEKTHFFNEQKLIIKCLSHNRTGKESYESTIIVPLCSKLH